MLRILKASNSVEKEFSYQRDMYGSVNLLLYSYYLSVIIATFSFLLAPRSPLFLCSAAAEDHLSSGFHTNCQ